MADQEVNAVANQIGRGFMTGIEQKNAIVDEFELLELFIAVGIRVEIGSGNEL